MSTPTRRTARAVFIAALAIVALAGCTGQASSSAEGSGPVSAVGADAAAPDAALGAPEAAGVPEPAGAADVRAQLPTTDRQVVRTAYVAITVDDVSASAFAIHGLVAKSNGVVSNEQTQASGDAASSMITAQVPSGSLDTFIADVSKLGTVDSVTVTADDVTAQAVDLDARIKALQTSIDRMTQLLAQAKQIDDLLAIETQLSTRQAELDSLTAQRRYLSTQVAMSTVTIAVTSVVDIAPVDAPGFLSGLQNGWAAFVSVVVVAVTALGFLLPFLLIGLLVAVPLVYFAIRHARRTRRYARVYADDQQAPMDDRAPTATPT